MGAVLNTAGAAEIAAELACCACSSVCGFLCKDQATRAKLRYCTLLLFATIMSFVMLVPGMRRNIDRIPNFCGKMVARETCDKFFGFGAVYRVMLSMTSFYGLFAVITVRVERTNSFRAKIHNGFWIVKLIILLGITIGTFFIPKKSEFFRIWMYACLVGGFVFMMYQIVMVIDFGHSWSVSWAEKLDSNSSKLWYLAMVLSTLLMFTVSLAAFASFYAFFAGSHALTQCKANMFYITFVVIQCFLATVISVIPTVQQELAGAGLLQSSVVILYTVYLTFNTLSTEPDSMCNPLGKVILDYDKMSGINGEALFGCMLTFALIIFACTVRAHTTHFGKYGLALSESEEYALATFLKQRQKTSKDGEEPEISLDDFVGCSYSLFHIIMALASLHLLMILTNWHSPDQRSDMKRLVKNWASVWVQMASSFICILIYIWFLVTPLIRKIWGPLFGIVMHEDEEFRGRGHEIKVAKITNEKSTEGNAEKSKVDMDGVKRRDKVEKKSTVEGNSIGKIGIVDNDLSQGSLKRLKSMESLRSAVSAVTNRKARLKSEEDRNSANENKSDLSNDIHVIDDRATGKKRNGLTRFGSIESLRSGLSAISSATSGVRNKIRRKLKGRNGDRRTMENRNFNGDSSGTMDEEVRDFRNEKERRNSKVNHSLVSSRKPVDDRLRDIQDRLQRSYDSGASDRSGKSNRTLKKRPGSRAEQTNMEKIVENQRFDNELPVRPEKNENVESLIGPKTNQFIDGIREVQREPSPANIPEEQTARLLNEHPDRPQSNASNYGTSTFQQKAQDPQIARELLRLQWKILRMQAKVVKIQEKIMRIQAEDEAAKKNAMEAAEQLEPPLGQSSMVAGSVYVRKTEVEDDISRKQHG